MEKLTCIKLDYAKSWELCLFCIPDYAKRLPCFFHFRFSIFPYMSSCFPQNKYKCSCCNGWICIDAIVMSCKLVTFSEVYFWPIQFRVTGSLKLKIGHIVLVLSGRRYCGLMSLEQSDPSKIG